MHDPSTQAFVIPYGWRTETFKNGKKWRYWKPFITIWHEDPETDGSDDSCGYSRPKLTAEQRDICKNLARDEASEPWFMALDAKSNPDALQCEALLRGAFMLVSRCLENRYANKRGLRKPVTIEEATKWASIMTHNSIDNFRTSLCFKSGWHSNGDGSDDKRHREQNATGFFMAIMAYVLRERRPWYRHPKWHVWHWKLQVHVVQTFKRWAFSRCCKCGKRFAWGYSPTTNSWSGVGPRWFKGEPDVFHGDCDRPKSECCAPAVSAA